ncbi:MAG: hypothetical protein NVS3B2_00490 [Ramlibacter sp.]
MLVAGRRVGRARRVAGGPSGGPWTAALLGHERVRRPALGVAGIQALGFRVAPLCPIAPEQAAAWQSGLARLLPDVREGDRITGINQPGRPPLFLLNGKPLGEMGDAGFARRFFGIWLSPQTSEPGLRTALLAGTEP